MDKTSQIYDLVESLKKDCYEQVSKTDSKLANEMVTKLNTIWFKVSDGGLMLIGSHR